MTNQLIVKNAKVMKLRHKLTSVQNSLNSSMCQNTTSITPFTEKILEMDLPETKDVYRSERSSSRLSGSQKTSNRDLDASYDCPLQNLESIGTEKNVQHLTYYSHFRGNSATPSFYSSSNEKVKSSNLPSGLRISVLRKKITKF